MRQGPNHWQTRYERERSFPSSAHYLAGQGNIKDAEMHEILEVSESSKSIVRPQRDNYYISAATKQGEGVSTLRSN
jgi:hypothetical protein